jgi:hypothetical protein
MSLLKDGRIDTITHNGVARRVNYTHLRHLSNGKIESKSGTTIAFILDDNYNVIAQGEYTTLNGFRKKLGRIVATGRLLKALGLPRK